MKKYDFGVMERPKVKPGYFQIVTTRLFSSREEAWAFIDMIVKGLELYKKRDVISKVLGVKFIE